MKFVVSPGFITIHSAYSGQKIAFRHLAWKRLLFDIAATAWCYKRFVDQSQQNTGQSISLWREKYYSAVFVSFGGGKSCLHSSKQNLAMIVLCTVHQNVLAVPLLLHSLDT